MVSAVDTSGQAMQRVFEKKSAIQDEILAKQDAGQQKVKSEGTQAVRNSVNNQQSVLGGLNAQSYRGSVLNMMV
jgi:hypothetical protein